jgi:hypothetical protein
MNSYRHQQPFQNYIRYDYADVSCIIWKLQAVNTGTIVFQQIHGYQHFI